MFLGYINTKININHKLLFLSNLLYYFTNFSLFCGKMYPALLFFGVSFCYFWKVNSLLILVLFFPEVMTKLAHRRRWVRHFQ